MKKFLIFGCFLILFWKGCDLFDNFTSNRLIMKEIEKEFSGIIIDKYSPRENTLPMVLKIKNQNTVHDILFSKGVMNISSIGDSIYKQSNDNYVYIIKSNGKIYKKCFQKITNERRNSKLFPKEWKNKWLDTINCGE